jgi:Trp operon repressor
MGEFLSDPSHSFEKATCLEKLAAPVVHKKSPFPSFLINIFGLKRSAERRECQLLGRVKQVEALSLADELSLIVNELQKQVKDPLYLNLATLIKSSLDELQLMTKSHQGILDQAQMIKKLHEWIENAKIWAKIRPSLNNREQLAQFVVDHNINELISHITRDVSFVKSYPKEALEVLQIDEETRAHVAQELEQKLAPYIQKLIKLNEQLEKIPVQTSLDGIKKLKADVYEQRGHYINRVLETVDSVISNHFGEAILHEQLSDEQEHPRLKEISAHIGELEQESHHLIKMIQEPVSREERKAILERLFSIQERVTHLYTDMTTPSEVIDRLEALEKLLSNQQ